ncbi:hypothetical protein BHE74_00024721 [Ensete ventricosum]|nr:hypothetical protein BHE74_00024721 [Ensete ventricosum]RZS20403.1 hypothetical protein BHM03_00052909 [Ensete ventricosum]
MLKKCRAKTHLKNLYYQRAVARLYNQRIRPRPIGTRDLALRRVEVSDLGHTRGKFTPRWEGSYRVTDETYTLSTMEGKTLPQT